MCAWNYPQRSSAPKRRRHSIIYCRCKCNKNIVSLLCFYSYFGMFVYLFHSYTPNNSIHLLYENSFGASLKTFLPFYNELLKLSINAYSISITLQQTFPFSVHTSLSDGFRFFGRIANLDSYVISKWWDDYSIVFHWKREKNHGREHLRSVFVARK